MARRPRKPDPQIARAMPPEEAPFGASPDMATHHTGFEDADGHPMHRDDMPGTSHNDREEMDDPFGSDPPDEPGTGDDMGGSEGMDEEAYENAVGQAINSAEMYIDMEVSPDREMLARYYAAEDFGTEEPGRSAVVAPEVRNGVLAHMPGLMRLFAGTDRYVEFKAGPGTPQGQADFQTDYVSFVIENDTPNSYLEILSAVDNAVRVRSGILTWWWEEREEVTRTHFSGLDEDAFALLQMEAMERSSADENLEYSVEVERQEPDEMQAGGSLVPPAFSEVASAGPEMQNAMAMMGQGPQQTFVYDGYVQRRVIRKRARFRCVPPEEFIVSPTTSTDLNKYQLIGTREIKTIGELVALGHNEDEIRDAIDGHGSTNEYSITNLDMNGERLQRAEAAGQMERLFDTGIAEVDPASEMVKYCVVYLMIDADGDGIPERRKICTVGNNYRIIYDEVYEDDGVPFSLGCPYPEPHSPFGMSVSDMLLDVQEVKSDLMRGTLDSLTESITSRIAFWQGKVNVDDVLNSRRGAAIRTNDVPSNVIQNLASPFNGANTIPVIQYVDEEATKRGGKNPASPTGFDPDSTQSTAREAVGSMIDGANERTEYIARNLAETLFKPFFQGIRSLIVRNQDHKRTITLMGQDVSVDPRPWKAGLDVRVLVGTGRTSQTKKVMALQAVIQQQQLIFEKYGPGNGFVTLENMINAQQDYLRASGFSDPYRYMGRFDPNREAQMAAAAAKKAQQPTPEQMLAQIQSQKNQQDFAAKMAKLQNDRDMVLLRDDTQRDKAEQDFSLGVAKILGDYGIKIDEAHVRQAMAANDMASSVNQDEAAATAAEAAAAAPAGANGGQG